MRRVFMAVYFGISVFCVTAQDKTHMVKPGETLYAISRQYGVSVQQLISLNNMGGNTALKPGQTLTIQQTYGLVSAPVKPTPAAPATKARVHTVTKGETLYAICKKYGVSVNEVKQWNSLTDLNVRPGQQLVVNKTNQIAVYKPTSVPSTPDTPYQEEEKRKPLAVTSSALRSNTSTDENTALVAAEELTAPVVSASPGEYPEVFNRYATEGQKIKKVRGTAGYLKDEMAGNQYLAFYNAAPSGSIIRVTNLLNQKTIFVKVVGKLPATDLSNDLVLKLSSKAADELEATDARFLVEVSSFSRN